MSVTPQEAVQKMTHDRPLMIGAAIVTLIGAILYIAKRNAAPAVAAVDPNTGTPTVPGGTGATGPSAGDVAIGQQGVENNAIQHSASFENSFGFESKITDAGTQNGGTSGSGGLKIGPISIFGGGSGSHQNAYQVGEDVTQSGSVKGGNLSEAEFSELLQLSQAEYNQLAATQKSADQAAHERENLFYNRQPEKAPNGMQLVAGPDGHYYWVKNGQAITPTVPSTPIHSQGPIPIPLAGAH